MESTGRRCVSSLVGPAIESGLDRYRLRQRCVHRILVERCAPSSVTGLDPAEAQLAFARSRPAARGARFQLGDAMALPYPAATFDAAVMALVIFFVPDPAKALTEMVRVVKPGGLVTAYAWDLMNGGHPFEAMQIEMRELGIPPTLPPSAGVSRIEAMRDLWAAAGLLSIETNAYTVFRTYDDFDDLWTTSSLTSSIAPKFNAMPLADVEILKARMRARSTADASGRITCGARVTAVHGRVPQ
ncbi:MAG: class I SAM-dependent methyltransferase [Burkholderiales bacterium]